MPHTGDKLGSFQLQELLGSGSFGTVYRAVRVDGLDVSVAIKIPHNQSLSPQELMQEAKIWLHASGHPNIVPVLEANVYGGIFAIVSEYVAGGSLRKKIGWRTGQGLSVEAVRRMGDGILAGLEHLHSKNLLHRDLKPDNILLQGGEPRITDFGLAKLLSRPNGKGSGQGTLLYMPPEAFRNQMDARSDLWSVGVILYELLTGDFPFYGDDEASLIGNILYGEAPKLPASVPSPLRAVVEKALQKDQVKRYASATEMRQALAASGRPAPAPAPRSRPSPSSPVVTRRQMLIGGGVAAVTIGAWGLTHILPSLLWPRFIASDRTKTNAKDGAEMIFIPAGEFLMGDDDQSDNPRHRVTLSGYWIYKNLVTVGMYRKFCDATGRKMPDAPAWDSWKDDQPIANVNWFDAKAYCDWAGVRLPTEAEWEKAARGTDGRFYPWGNEWDGSKCANSVFSNTLTGTKPVGSYPGCASPYGLLDMAGNIWEWCLDWYDEHSLYTAPSDNPTRPTLGTERVLRGGSWSSHDPNDFRSANRFKIDTNYKGLDSGFRCAAGS